LFSLDKFFIGLPYELALQEGEFPCFLVLLPRQNGPQLVTGIGAAPPYPIISLLFLSFVISITFLLYIKSYLHSV